MKENHERPIILLPLFAAAYAAGDEKLIFVTVCIKGGLRMLAELRRNGMASLKCAYADKKRTKIEQHRNASEQIFHNCSSSRPIVCKRLHKPSRAELTRAKREPSVICSGFLWLKRERPMWGELQDRQMHPASHLSAYAAA